jgi:phosphate starvation-inducible PhoH-like protein
MAQRNRQERNPHGKRARREQHPPSDFLAPTPRIQRSTKPLEAQTEAQAAYLNAIDVYDLVFCMGPAGTGKTYIPAARAAEALARRDIEKFIITRPAVGADEEYGFLPGELEEKIAPWAAPVIAILEERLGSGTVEYMLQAKKIEIAPLGMLRGHTFNNTWVLFDEAQNATPKQMKLFLTRFGKNCKMIVDADPYDQCDIGDGHMTGFVDAWELMKGHPKTGFIEFTLDDIVRSGMCRDILLRYHTRKGTNLGNIGFHAPAFLAERAN